MEEDGVIDMDLWRSWRDEFLTTGSGLPDIDVSIGFDTFLTSVVGQYYLAIRYSKRANLFAILLSSHILLQAALK